jgi:hypothetical protein
MSTFIFCGRPNRKRFDLHSGGQGGSLKQFGGTETLQHSTRREVHSDVSAVDIRRSALIPLPWLIGSQDGRF